MDNTIKENNGLETRVMVELTAPSTYSLIPSTNHNNNNKKTNS